MATTLKKIPQSLQGFSNGNFRFFSLYKCLIASCRQKIFSLAPTWKWKRRSDSFFFYLKNWAVNIIFHFLLCYRARLLLFSFWLSQQNICWVFVVISFTNYGPRYSWEFIVQRTSPGSWKRMSERDKEAKQSKKKRPAYSYTPTNRRNRRRKEQEKYKSSFSTEICSSIIFVWEFVCLFVYLRRLLFSCCFCSLHVTFSSPLPFIIKMNKSTKYEYSLFFRFVFGSV